MVNTPPPNVYEPSSATAAADPDDKGIVQLTFYTHDPDAWHHFRLPRQMAQVLEGEIRRALSGGFQTQVMP